MRSISVYMSPSVARDRIIAAAEASELNARGTFADGTRAWWAGPGYGDNCWLQDTWFTLSRIPWLFSTAQVGNLLDKWTAAWNQTLGFYPVALDANYQPTYWSGEDEVRVNPMAEANLTMPLVAAHYYAKSLDLEKIVAILPDMRHGLDVLPRSETTGLVHVTAGDTTYWIPWGFGEMRRDSGDVMQGSCMLWEASKAMRTLYLAAGDTTKAGEMDAWMSTLQAGIRSQLWNEASGMFFAATEQNQQIDIPGSAYAVYLGIPTAEQSSSVSDWLALNYRRVSYKGYIRQSPENFEYAFRIGGTTHAYPSCDMFWSVFHMWVAEALLVNSSEAAVRVVTDYARGTDLTMECWTQPTEGHGSTMMLMAAAQMAGFCTNHPELFT